MHRKYHTTQKNTIKDLHIEINFTHFCSITHCAKLHKVKPKYLPVHTLNICMQVHVIVSN
jgi:hypothetical protein